MLGSPIPRHLAPELPILRDPKTPDIVRLADQPKIAAKDLRRAREELVERKLAHGTRRFAARTLLDRANASIIGSGYGTSYSGSTQSANRRSPSASHALSHALIYAAFPLRVRVEEHLFRALRSSTAAFSLLKPAREIAGAAW